MDNPFRIEGVVRPPHFMDREAELARIEDAMERPGSKLLVYGPRRMGKTSAVTVAAERVEERDVHVVVADFSTASTAADLANRLLSAAARSLGRRWRDLPGELARRLRISLRLETDPGTGIPIPVVEAGLRTDSLERQQQALGGVLDTLDAMARERDARLAVVLDEFQEIRRFGEEQAEWHLRGVVQRHERASYVLAGSRDHLIRRMVGRDGAFYKLFDTLVFGPIDPELLASWVDRRTTEGGRVLDGLGARCIAAAGPRTRDVVQLARKAFDLAPEAGGAGQHATGDREATGEAARADAPPSADPLERLVRRAFLEIVEEEGDLARALWEKLTPHQQNVVRAVAAADRGLTAADTLERFGLGQSGTVANTARALVESGYLVRSEESPGYRFDSPYFRGWVIRHTLADLGLRADPLGGG